MKRTFFYLLFSLFCFFSYSQGFTLKVHSQHLAFDSLKLQKFNGNRGYKTLISLPHSTQVVFKQKRALPAGYYRVEGDTALLFHLLISDEKKENFVVTISNGAVVFENSEENNHYIAFNKKTEEFIYKRDSLNNIFEKAQATETPQKLQQIASTLIEQMNALLAADEAYKMRVAAENKGTLLASIANFSREIRPIAHPKSQNEFLQYYVKNIFKTYNFSDSRLTTHPMLANKMNEWCKFVFDLSIEDGVKAVNLLLDQAQANTETYEVFFDLLERKFGFFVSDYWTEEIYLKMLNNALNYNNLSSNRRTRYEALYQSYNKNLSGQQVPDFQIMWPDNHTSSLYDFESEYLILFFQNPDCPTCAEMHKILSENEELSQAIDSGRIKVLSVYFNENENLWRTYVKTKGNPRFFYGWEWQHKIVDDELFYLPNIPYLFLLDKDKKVIKKELFKNEISYYLHQLKLL